MAAIVEPPAVFVNFVEEAPLSQIGCSSDTVLDITGLTTYGPHRRRTSSAMSACPYSTALGLQLEAMCDGRPRCYISNQLMQLTKDQCPGVSSVFVEVDCKPPGTIRYDPLSTFKGNLERGWRGVGSGRVRILSKFGVSGRVEIS